MEATLSERITFIQKNSNLSQAEFAGRISISQQYLSQICHGKRVPSDRTISDICRVFRVNRRYLEHGEEPRYMPEADSDTDFINELLAKMDSPFVETIRAIMRVYMELPPEDQRKFDAFAANLRNKLNQENRD